MVLIGDAAMVAVNERERQLLEKIAAEGKATKIGHDELRVAKVLEGGGLSSPPKAGACSPRRRRSPSATRRRSSSPSPVKVP